MSIELIQALVAAAVEARRGLPIELDFRIVGPVDGCIIIDLGNDHPEATQEQVRSALSKNGYTDLLAEAGWPEWVFAHNLPVESQCKLVGAVLFWG